MGRALHGIGLGVTTRSGFLTTGGVPGEPGTSWTGSRSCSFETEIEIEQTPFEGRALTGWTMICAEMPLAAANDGLFPERFKRMNKAGVPSFGIVASTTLASIAMIVNYLGSSGATAFTTLPTATISTRSPPTSCAGSLATEECSVSPRGPRCWSWPHRYSH